MSRFKLLYFVIFIINLYRTNAQISDKRLCVDEKCEVPISRAKTLLRYSSPDSRILSFAPNADITIYSKSAGSREDLWGGEINGKRGYIPKHMVRETKIFQKPTLLVDTEFANETETKQVPSKVEPDKVQEPYEVIDGTTIYLSPQENISPSSTDSPIQSTAVPVGAEKILSAEQPTTKDNAVGNEEKNGDVNGSPSVENTDEKPVERVGGESDDDVEEEDDGEIDIDGDEEEDESEEAEDTVEHGEIEHDVSKKPQALSNEDTQPQTEKISTESKIDGEIAKENEKLSSSSESIEQNVQEPTLTNQAAENVTTGSPEPSEVKSSFNTPESIESVSSLTKNIASDVNDLNIEATVAPPVETTTIGSDIEVPNPFDDSFVEVTPNPLEGISEEPNIAKDIIPTLPPLGLFAASSSNSVASAAPETKSSEEIVGTQSGEITEETIKEAEENQVSTEEIVETPRIEETEVPIEEIIGTPGTEEKSISIEETGETLGAEDKQESTEEIVETDRTEEKQTSIEESSETFRTEENQVSTEEISGAPTIEEEIPEIASQSQENQVEDNSLEKTTESQSVVKPDEAVNIEEEQPVESEETVEESQGPGLIDHILSLFGLGTSAEQPLKEEEALTYGHMVNHAEHDSEEPYCDAASCETDETQVTNEMDLFNFNPNILLYLGTTAVSVVFFLVVYTYLDKSKRVSPLIARINGLEKQLLIVVKENQILQEKVATDSGYETNDRVPNEVVENLKQDLVEVISIKNALEDQVQSLEKELENSTEVGMELNKMLSEILSSENGSDLIKSNVEHLQRQLVEQQSTINSVNETLAETNTENHEIRLELELSNKKVLDLQSELDKLLLNVLKIEEEKESQQSTLEHEIANHRQKYDEISNRLKQKEGDYNTELKQLKNRLDQTERKLELKIREHDVLAETLKQLKSMKNRDEATLQNLLEVTGIKAELQLLKIENQRFTEKLQQEHELKTSYEKRSQSAVEELHLLREKYDEADKLKVEMQTKLEVLSNYFKDREAQWQKEISKHEALWAEKEGEATSTTERMKFMQEQLQNYKAQTESLKQEILSQEIELKSQISVLEKKVHENWVSARQAERKLEEAKQEAAQLRHRLTLRERAIQEDKNQQRLQSPIEQNGDMPLDSPASPPLLYGGRDHITKSPPLSGLPPFLPPPPGVPFMPPPLHGVPPFIPPPPPNMFPGDHRPPPLGRMSSPPLNSRYSPSSRGYSPYDRNSSSPSDSEYGTSPPHRRTYSPFNNRDDRRDYKRPPPGRSNGRSMIKGGASSGSGNSNESLEKINRQQSKV